MMKLFDGKFVLTAVLKIAHIILIFLALLVIYSILINNKSDIKKNEPTLQISQEPTKEEVNVTAQQIVQEPITERCECPNNKNDKVNVQIQQLPTVAAFEKCNKNNTNAEEVDLGLLNRLAKEFGTDKGPIGHNYTRIYAKYFAPLKEKPIRFLELGLFKGNSVKMWEKYFTHAELHFLDYSPQYLQYYSNRSSYHYMDQTDKPKVKEFAEKYGPFDVIIDDASHRSPETIAAFEALISHVKPGGMYFIEDLHLLYYTQWGGAGNPKNPKLSENSIHHFLRDRIEDVHAPGAASEWASNFNMTAGIITTLNDYSRRMESIQFYNGLCIITIREDILKP